MKRTTLAIASAALAFAMLFALLAFVPQPVRPASAQSVGAWAVYTLRAGTSSIAADTNTSGLVVADYGRADCYQTVDVASAQTVTTTLQHSVDNSNWINGQVLTVQTADGTVYLTTLITGTYLRASIDLFNTNPVTPTIKCAVKDLSN